MATCRICRASSKLTSKRLGLCARCLRSGRAAVLAQAAETHHVVRKQFGLPQEPPKASGAFCNLCANQSRIPPGGRGYCGLRQNVSGFLTGGTPRSGNVDWYYDELPTNCVADWVCAGGVGAGYPEFAHAPGAEIGYKNLAVFYGACNFDCLFCQNWHYRLRACRPGNRTSEELAGAVDGRTSCICFFGGDPTPQLAHAIAASRAALRSNPRRILRICWETNGGMNPHLLERMIELSLASGGCLKFDLKAYDDSLHRVLCSVSNARTLENFARAAKRSRERPAPPLVVASTLLVPGYVGEEDVGQIAGFIASLDPEIPYALLAFHPHFMMEDLPRTSRSHALSAEKAARAAGLRRVRIGNLHLLSEDYE